MKRIHYVILGYVAILAILILALFLKEEDPLDTIGPLLAGAILITIAVLILRRIRIVGCSISFCLLILIGIGGALILF